MFDRLREDLRFAVRTLLKAPAFAGIVIVTLALGIGANTAIFSITDQLLLRLLPVKAPDELVSFENPGAFSGRQEGRNTFSYPMYRDFRDRTEVFSGVIASYLTNMTIAIDGQSQRVDGQLVSGNYFDVLGVQPALGRAFTQNDDKVPGGHPVAMISYGFWERRFARDPAVLNRSVTINGHPMTIVGVEPRGFYGITIGQAPDIVVPVAMKAQMTPTWDDMENRRSRWLTLMARLKPGVSLAQAEASMNVLYRQLNEMEVKALTGMSDAGKARFVAKHLFVRPGAKGNSQLRNQFSTPILVLMGMVGLVLLIACANVANLLLARGAARQKDVAIRLALGASRGAIVRQRLVESLLLAAAGGAIGLPLALSGAGTLIRMLPAGGGGQTLTAAPDLRVVAFAAAVSVVTAILFGIAPALHATRPELTSTLKDEAGSVVGGTGHGRLRKTLVVAQVGLSVLLLAGAALFARSLYNLKTLNPGFEADRLLSFSIDPALSGYSRDRGVQLVDDIQKRLATIPGVRAAAPSVIQLMSDSEWSSTVRVEGYTAKEGENLNPDVNSVGPGYFATLGQPLIVGREFSDKDVQGATKVAIINETMARYFFGGESPIGRHIGFRGRSEVPDIEIVGVVRDAKSATMREEIPRFVYTPYMQDTDINQMTFYVRTQGAATTVAAAARDTVRQIDPNLPVYDMKSVDAQMDESLFIERTVAALSVLFGALATLLAAIGLYGVMSYSVARRTREIGIRMALGAEQASVLWLVLREVAMLVGLGVLAGVPAALALGRVVKTQLYGLSPTDPAALAAATALLASVALLAGYLPARRAARVNPIVALRYE